MELFDGPQRVRNMVWITVAWLACSIPAGVAPGRLVLIGVVLFMFVRLPAKSLLPIYLMLTLVPEGPGDRAFLGLWSWPIQNLGIVWYANISTAVPFVPVPLSASLIAALVLLWRSMTGSVGPWCTPGRTEFQLSRTHRLLVLGAIGAVGVWLVYGQIGGGDPVQAYVASVGYVQIAAIIGAAMTLADRRTTSFMVNVMIVIACARALLCVGLYFYKFRYVFPPTLFITTHADSVVWALSVVALIARYLETPSAMYRRVVMVAIPILVAALVVNTRRLSFVILAASLVYVIASTEWSARRRMSRVMPILLPLAAGYLALGLMLPPTKFFKPVQAVESVNDAQDSSSLTREAENYNLILSIKENSVLGRGFGFEYRERVLGGDISHLFPEYRFHPHNNVLSLMYFVGPIGFALVLMPVLLALQRTHLVRRRSEHSAERVAAAVGASAVIAYFLQGWGDFGFNDLRVLAVTGLFAGACAGRMASRAAKVEVAPRDVEMRVLR